MAQLGRMTGLLSSGSVAQSAGATQLFFNIPLRQQGWRNGRNAKHAPVLGPAVPTFRAGADFHETLAQREDVPTFVPLFQLSPLTVSTTSL